MACFAMQNGLCRNVLNVRMLQGWQVAGLFKLKVLRISEERVSHTVIPQESGIRNILLLVGFRFFSGMTVCETRPLYDGHNLAVCGHS